MLGCLSLFGCLCLFVCSVVGVAGSACGGLLARQDREDKRREAMRNARDKEDKSDREKDDNGDREKSYKIWSREETRYTTSSRRKETHNTPNKLFAPNTNFAHTKLFL